MKNTASESKAQLCLLSGGESAINSPVTVLSEGCLRKGINLQHTVLPAFVLAFVHPPCNLLWSAPPGLMARCLSGASGTLYFPTQHLQEHPSTS